MAVSLEIGIGDLRPEFGANALVIFGAIHTAGTITAGTLETFFNGFHHLLVFVQTDSHSNTSFPYYYK